MPGSQTQNSVAELPVLDISKPLNLNPSSLTSLSQACKKWGFFRIINHGISNNLYTKIFTLSHHFFTLPSHKKLVLGPSSSVKSYTPHFIASPFFESLRVSGPDFLGSAQDSAAAVFDSHGSEFSEVLQEYGSKMSELSKRIIKIVLMILGDGLEKKYYESEFKNCHGYLRIINYTPPKSTEEDEVEGLGMHTDMSCVTLVFQDETGGLQVKSKEGKWMDINPCEKTLVVNIGDMLQAWSNEKFRSSEHRVILRRPVNRFSLAFFWCFEDEKVISAPDEVVEGEGDGRIYKPFLCSDYLKFRESSERGKFEKVGFTVRDFAGINDSKFN